jgi:thiamine-phosphate diphosphorylase
VTVTLTPPLISAITNRHLLSDREDEACGRLVEWSAAIAQAGVDVLQVRERGLQDRVLARLVRDIVAAAGAGRTRVLVNDRTDLAMAASAHGVHLPSSAPSAAIVRRIVPERAVIGRSVHCGDDFGAIERAGGCDYLIFGMVFPSTGKPADHPVAGIEALARACATTSLPILAIGGITVSLAGEIAHAGAAGCAAITLFFEPWRQETRERARVAHLTDTVAGLRNAFVGRSH